jgi:NAD(P)-dependent dehydrogenase (short-subunit alcohol dehydrogenase family)
MMSSLTTSPGGRLAGRRALITGAANGQGRAVARRFAAEGAGLVVVDRDAAGIEALARELQGQGADALGVCADVQDESDVQRAVAAAVDGGGLDVLYNNAGVYWPERDAPADRLSRTVWDEILAINATGALLFCKHALPALLASDAGVVLNVASVAGYAGDPACHAYAASKGAIIALTLSLAQAYGPAGLRAVAICPGFIETPMLAPFLAEEESIARLRGATALRRLGTSEEVADVALFLASREAAFVSSVVVPVHGGLVK